MKLHIGQEIRREVSARRISITAFAEMINTTRQNVYGIFQRESIDTALLQRIGAALDRDFFLLYVVLKDVPENQNTGVKIFIQLDEDYNAKILKSPILQKITEILK